MSSHPHHWTDDSQLPQGCGYTIWNWRGRPDPTPPSGYVQIEELFDDVSRDGQCLSSPRPITHRQAYRQMHQSASAEPRCCCVPRLRPRMAPISTTVQAPKTVPDRARKERPFGSIVIQPAGSVLGRVSGQNQISPRPECRVL